MLKTSKVVLKEIIDFYEACGRNRNKTIWHFVRANKKVSRVTLYRILKRYDLEGPAAVLEIKKRQKCRKVSEKTARVLQLLKEDPTVSVREGSQILGISHTCFGRIKRDLLFPEQLTPEKDVQNVKAPLPQEGVGGKLPSSDVNLKLDELDLGGIGGDDFDYGDDDGLNDHGFENEIDCKPSPSTTVTSAPCKKRRERFQHCLVCYIRLDSKIEYGSNRKMTGTRSRPRKEKSSITPLSFTINEDDAALGENLNVIFALKYIFGLNSSDLVEFMEISKGKDPKGWYHLCSECDVIIKDAVAIQHKVIQLRRELEMCKSRIKDKVMESSENYRKKIGVDKDDINVTKLIRQSVCPQQSKRLSDDGGKVYVKAEPMDADEGGSFDDHDPGPFGNDSIELAEDAPNGGPFPETNDTNTSSMVRINTQEATVGNPSETLPNLTVKPKLVVCDLCGEEMRLFTLPLHTLRVHNVLMDGYTEFKCLEEGCQYKTVYKSNFEDHMKNVHVPRNQRKWTCAFCGEKFKCKSHLRNHEDAYHNNQTRPYQCHICGQGFKVNSALWCHIRGVHQGYVSPYRRRLMARNKQKTSVGATTTPTDWKPESTTQQNYEPEMMPSQ